MESVLRVNSVRADSDGRLLCGRNLAPFQDAASLPITRCNTCLLGRLLFLARCSVFLLLSLDFVVTDSHQGLPTPQRFIAIAAFFIGSLALMIDASIAGVMLPTVATELNVDGEDAVLIVTSYQLVLAMLLMPMAALGGRVGLRRMYCGGLLLHGLAAPLCFMVDSLPALVAVRALQAVGTAAAMSVAFGLIRLVYPTEQLGRGLAINTIANASGTALAPAAGGLIVSVLSWEWVFVAILPFSLLTLCFSRAMPGPLPTSKSFNIRGAMLCAITFGLVVVGLETAIRTSGAWFSWLILITALVVAYIFVRHEAKEDEPVLPIDLMTYRPFSLALTSNICGVLGSVTVLLYMPFLLQDGRGFGPAEIGAMLAFYAVGSVMFAPLSGYLSDRIPVPLLCTVGLSLVLVGLTNLMLLPSQPEHFDVSWRLWICGSGFGMFFSPNARMIVGSVAPQRAASAGSLLSTTRMLGLASGATLVAALLTLGFGETLVPFFVSAGLVVVALLISVQRLLTEGKI